MAAGSEKLPPSSPVTTTLPPRMSTPVTNCNDFSEPTKSQAENTPPVAAMIALRRLRIGGIEGERRACRERGGPLFSVDVGDDRRLREHGARERQAHHADAAQSDEQGRSAIGAADELFSAP